VFKYWKCDSWCCSLFVFVADRNNAKGYDLNRNFPDYFVNNSQSIVQPETRAIMDWLLQRQFVLSASLHGGALVANYPYDNKPLGLDVVLHCYLWQLFAPISEKQQLYKCGPKIHSLREVALSWHNGYFIFCAELCTFLNCLKILGYFHW